MEEETGGGAFRPPATCTPASHPEAGEPRGRPSEAEPAADRVAFPFLRGHRGNLRRINEIRNLFDARARAIRYRRVVSPYRTIDLNAADKPAGGIYKVVSAV